ncbi:MAG: hydroxyacid dehydrogenase [Candidatus Shapirobacteria bacterium]
MKIAFFELKEWEKEVLPSFAKKLKADIYPSEVEEDLKTAAEYEIISTFIYSDLSAKILKKLPALKMIATRSTGFDHIDLEYCQKNKIIVCNVPSYGENTVAEHTFALILALSRRIVEGSERVRQGGFSPNGLTGFDLKGKILGVVGVGKIGQWMTRYAKAFEMKVLGVTNEGHPKLEKKLGYQRVPLELCLKESDIISLHVPYCKATHHLINKQNIKRMKKGSLLINTARGPVVETEAILWALEQKILRGAGLDVLEEEEILDDPSALFSRYISNDDLKELVAVHLLREMPNVIITPHNAFNSKEAIKRIIQTTYENIRSFLANKTENQVS